MPGPFKGFSTQHTTKPEHAQPRHQPSARDQKARERLISKVSRFQAKFRGPAYITLESTALNTIYETFNPGFSVFLHLPTITSKITKDTPPNNMLLKKTDIVFLLWITTRTHNYSDPPGK